MALSLQMRESIHEEIECRLKVENSCYYCIRYWYIQECGCDFYDILTKIKCSVYFRHFHCLAI